MLLPLRQSVVHAQHETCGLFSGINFVNHYFIIIFWSQHDGNNTFDRRINSPCRLSSVGPPQWSLEILSNAAAISKRMPIWLYEWVSAVGLLLVVSLAARVFS